MYKHLSLLEIGVEPVWVFDGEASNMKSGVLEQRKARRIHFQAETDKAMLEGRTDDAMKYSKRSFRMSGSEVDAAKQLLKLLGATVVLASDEADLAMGLLSREHGVKFCFSEDSDLLVHGVDHLIRSDRQDSTGTGRLECH